MFMAMRQLGHRPAGESVERGFLHCGQTDPVSLMPLLNVPEPDVTRSVGLKQPEEGAITAPKPLQETSSHFPGPHLAEACAELPPCMPPETVFAGDAPLPGLRLLRDRN